MRTAALMLALALPITAQAARHEISFDHETLIAPWEVDRSYGGRNVDAFGIRGGYAALRDVRRRWGLVVQAGWRRAVRGQGLDDDSSSGAAALVADTWSVGLKADADVANIFYPYMGAHLQLVRASSKLDGLIGVDDDDPTQSSEQALAPAGSFVAGFEIMIPDRKLGWPVTAALFIEAGYQVSGSLRFQDAGDLPWGGAVVLSGIGLRF